MVSLNLVPRREPVSLVRSTLLPELLLKSLQDILHYSHNLAKVKGILVRLLRASKERQLYSTNKEDKEEEASKAACYF